MRSIKFRKAEQGKLIDGLFHEWGVVSTFENSPNTVGIVEDESGKVHHVYPEFIQFTDKPKFLQ